MEKIIREKQDHRKFINSRRTTVNVNTNAMKHPRIAKWVPPALGVGIATEAGSTGDPVAGLEPSARDQNTTHILATLEEINATIDRLMLAINREE